MRATAVSYMRTFRFTLVSVDEKLTETQISTMRFHWEGPHLIVSRGMQKDPPIKSLRDELESLGSHDLRVRLFELNDVLFREFNLVFDKLLDRGFLFMDSGVDEIAMEAVCFTNAQMLHNSISKP